MVDKNELRAAALSLEGVTEKSEYFFQRDGKNMIWPYPEKVHPKKPRVTRFDQYVIRVADLDDKTAFLQGEPDVFFTTDHYDGYHTVIVRLDVIDEDRLREIVQMAWECAPLRTTPKR